MNELEIQELDFNFYAGVLVYEPGDREWVIVHSGLTPAEKQATILSLQLAFAALDWTQKLFPIELNLEQRQLTN